MGIVASGRDCRCVAHGLRGRCRFLPACSPKIEAEHSLTCVGIPKSVVLVAGQAESTILVTAYRGDIVGKYNQRDHRCVRVRERCLKKQADELRAISTPSPRRCDDDVTQPDVVDLHLHAIDVGVATGFVVAKLEQQHGCTSIMMPRQNLCIGNGRFGPWGEPQQVAVALHPRADVGGEGEFEWT